MLALSGLCFYPVKSMGGIQLERAQVDNRGISHDRHWMLVDDDGGFLSQRSHPRMALIRTRLIPGGLRLSAPAMADLDVLKEGGGGELAAVQIWGEHCQAVAVGADADQWFSNYLESPCRLVYLSEQSPRFVDPRYAKPADQVGFADGFPMLLIAEASLTALNAKLTQPVTMDRFRPNLVVNGCQPHAEDNWRVIRIGEITFNVVKPCSRCAIITIDPLTSEQGKEPLTTLAGYRKREGKVYFGQNLIPQGEGTLRLGDEVVVLETA